MKGLYALLPVLCALAACEVESDDCEDAKRHLCEKIVGQGCNTATMSNAVNKIKDACGDSAGESFRSKAEAYCQANTSTFSTETCVGL